MPRHLPDQGLTSIATSYIVDVLDSLQLLNLDEEYSRARTWIRDFLTFDVDDEHHAFEASRLGVPAN